LITCYAHGVCSPLCMFPYKYLSTLFFYWLTALELACLLTIAVAQTVVDTIAAEATDLFSVVVFSNVVHFYGL
jgi:hypothetical protein